MDVGAIKQNSHDLTSIIHFCTGHSRIHLVKIQAQASLDEDDFEMQPLEMAGIRDISFWEALRLLYILVRRQYPLATR